MRRILIADDHEIVRQGIKQLLAEEFAPATLGEAGTGQGVLDAVRKEAWDVVVLDIGLPDKNGLEVLKELKALRPSQRVLVYSTYLEEEYAARVLRAGAAGFLSKEMASEELVGALNKILQGGTYVSPSFAERLAEGVSAKAPPLPHQALSDREYEVLCLLAQGKTVGDIALSLSLSITTVSTYRTRLLQKLRLKSTAELIRYAIENRLVD